jgi:hypothetical protein
MLLPKKAAAGRARRPSRGSIGAYSSATVPMGRQQDQQEHTADGSSMRRA